MRKVCLPKPLGLRLQDRDDDGVEVVEVFPGGNAAASGKVQVGDWLLDVNGRPVKERKAPEVLEMIQQCQGNVTISLAAAKKMTSNRRSKSASEEIVADFFFAAIADPAKNRKECTHSWSEETFTSPTWCSKCGSFLWGSWHQVSDLFTKGVKTYGQCRLLYPHAPPPLETGRLFNVLNLIV